MKGQSIWLFFLLFPTKFPYQLMRGPSNGSSIIHSTPNKEKTSCRQGLKNRKILDIGRHRNDNRHRLSIDGKIGQKSAKSPIYRRNIGGEPKNRRVEARVEKTEVDGKKSAINRQNQRYFQKIADFFQLDFTRVI